MSASAPSPRGHRIPATTCPGYLAIDVGGSKVALRLEADSREPRQTTFGWPAAGDVDTDLASLAAKLHLLCDRWNGPVEQVGVSMPATLDETGHVVTWPGRPTWTGVDVPAIVRRLVPRAAVRIADDGILGAIAEARAACCQDLLYVGVGTGVGGGLILNGNPHPPLHRGAFELGHLSVGQAGSRCSCGRWGCLQAIAAGPAILRAAGRLHGSKVSFTQLQRAWRAGSAWAVSPVEDACGALALAVVSVCELLHPALVLIGGGVAAGLPGFVPAVARDTRKLGRPGHPPPPVRTAVLGGLSSLRGAMLLARGATPRSAPEIP